MDEINIKSLRMKKIVYFNIAIVIMFMISILLFTYGLEKLIFLILGFAFLVIIYQGRRDSKPFNMYEHVFKSLKPLDDYEKAKAGITYSEIRKNKAKMAPFFLILVIVQLITQQPIRINAEEILSIFLPIMIVVMIATSIYIQYTGHRIDIGKGKEIYEYSRKNILIGIIGGIALSVIIFGLVFTLI